MSEEGPVRVPGSSLPPARPAPSLASELTGSLPCVRCRYDLRGLSVRAVCPECATPVRATVLSVVDPRASELRPIFRPRVTAAGLVLWSGAGLGAAVAGWVLWLIEALPTAAFDGYVAAAMWGVVVLAGLSGLGAVALVNPHPGIPARSRRGAVLAVLWYIPLCLVLWKLVIVEWYAGSSGGLGRWAFTSDVRNVLGLVVQALIILIVLGVRSNARLLAARSVLLRQGRVDRQTLLALVSVLAVSMAGDGLCLLARRMQPAETLLLLGQALILAGAALFTIGLVGVFVDCWRIRRVVLQPPLSLEALFEEPPGARMHTGNHSA